MKEVQLEDDESKPWAPIPMEREVRHLTTKQIAELLDKENPSEWEAWQVLWLPINTLR